ncbi:nucleotidyltransferase domain-containing protein [Kitasatospora sp. NBC_00240]|uniref:nucleotidyltransferase domain-containing protein n=1 Tax=Kitasatospora sp. NBC_00240 TaxID=2903567 RepID=UPI00225ABC3A|nr:nucleotidyltransferase domain-containing protein [Kitasatospora sp. NBC_00240]MCX5215569.1 nucleotidyltransferase domain-containing protein [Kitasatospora sp. NBC_00240]
MKRERGTRLLADMIDRLEGGHWPLGLVDEVYVFGSYARGALEPKDIDVVVEHGTDKRWLNESLHASCYGKDSYTSMKQGLRGNTRGISFQFRGRDSLTAEGFPLTLLWRRGEPFDLARQRLAALTPDPDASRAPRDHMLPAFAGIEDLVPRPARIELHSRHAQGEITITALTLDDGRPGEPRTTRHIERRWLDTSPLRRAAFAASSFLESRGSDLSTVALHGKRLQHAAVEETCFVDLGWHYFQFMSRYLDDGQSWLEVLNPHRTKTLRALLIEPADG